MPDTENYDVVVVGGGPAGSTVGGLLARNGHSVLIIERERFPRYHIGESMVPGIAPILEELGLTDEMDRRFQHKSGITLRWGCEQEPWRSDFGSTGSDYGHAWHVVRSEFDKLLLDNARRLGAQVVEEAHVTEVVGGDGGAVTGVVYTRGEERHRVRSRYVVDASGQNRTVSRTLTETTWQQDLRNVAVWCYFEEYTPTIEQPDDILCEALAGGGWMWAIPLAKDKLSLGYVLSAENFAEARRAGLDQRGILARGLHESVVVRTMVDADPPADVSTARDWSRVSDTFHGDGWVAIGDAAAFVDPLFSSGVWLGASGAWLAARALDAALVEPAHEKRAMERFDSVYRQLYTDMLGYVRFFTDPHRMREEYMERAQKVAKMYSKSSRIGFISLISGIAAVRDVVDFDPIGMDGLRDLTTEMMEKARAQAEAE